MAWQNSNTETGCGEQQLGTLEGVSTRVRPDPAKTAEHAFAKASLDAPTLTTTTYDRNQN